MFRAAFDCEQCDTFRTHFGRVPRFVGTPPLPSSVAEFYKGFQTRYECVHVAKLRQLIYQL